MFSESSTVNVSTTESPRAIIKIKWQKIFFNFVLATVGGNKSLQNKATREQSAVISTIFVYEWSKKSTGFDSITVWCDFNTIPVKMTSQKACK